MDVLLITPARVLRVAIGKHLAPHAAVDACEGFLSARARLGARSYDLLITSLRLGAHNGLHLVHLAASLGLQVRTVVFDTDLDVYLARAVQAAGAFFEHGDRVAAAAPTYLRVPLPPRDRRDPVRFDRRAQSRGGRRAADLIVPLAS